MVVFFSLSDGQQKCDAFYFHFQDGSRLPNAVWESYEEHIKIHFNISLGEVPYS